MSHRITAAVALTLIAGLASAPFVAARTSRVTTELDVAMDGSSFFFEGAVNANGAPARGTPFVIEGYIYPGGTLRQQGLLSGVLADGSPEFPDRVLGTWICRGWHLLDGDAQTGAVVATTQIFDFNDERRGHTTIVSEGIELADFDRPFRRAITGGTGGFRGQRGQHLQTYVGHGMNASGGFNTTFRFERED